MTDDMVRWRDLEPDRDWTDRLPGDPDPDDVVEVRGKPLYKFDEAKARSLVERCRKIGGTQFRASIDLTNMMVDWSADADAHVVTHGFHLVLDESLPENTVAAE